MEVSVLPSVTSPSSSSLPPSQGAGNGEYFKHKNLLQQYAQKSGMPLPLYQTVNIGVPHLPRFVSTVNVNGLEFKSSGRFCNRKAAEQDVARIALEGLRGREQQEGIQLLQLETTFCKSILNEYAVKMSIPLPTYSNTRMEGLLPTFISTVIFNGNSYRGQVGKNKKEAEQLAARSIIESILGDSSRRSVMVHIIKAKGKLYAALHKGDQIAEGIGMVLPSGENSSKCVIQELQNGSTNCILLTNTPLVVASPCPTSGPNPVQPPHPSSCMSPTNTPVAVSAANPTSGPIPVQPPYPSTCKPLSNTPVVVSAAYPTSEPTQVQLPQQVEIRAFKTTCAEVEGALFAAVADVGIGLAYEGKKKQKKKKKKHEEENSENKKPRTEVQST